MSESSDAQKRKAPRGDTPPAKKHNTGRRDQVTTDVGPKQLGIEDEDLLDPLDTFFEAEEEMWKKWARNLFLKNGATFSFHAQEFLVFSLTYEVLIVINDFPESEQLSDEEVGHFKDDLKVLHKSMGPLRDMV